MWARACLLLARGRGGRGEVIDHRQHFFEQLGLGDSAVDPGDLGKVGVTEGESGSMVGKVVGFNEGLD